MKKYVLKATALAIGALVGNMAVADTNLDTGAVTGTTAFASELNYNSTATPAGTAISVGSVISSKLGFGVSGGQNRYIRVDLTNAKINGAALTGASLAMAAAPAFANVTVVQGGAVGDTSVVFQVTANAAGHASAQTVQLTLGNLDVISTGSKVGITYKLYETAVDAANNSAATLYSKAGDVFTFSAGLKYSLTPGSNTVSVEKSFKEFQTTNPGASISATQAQLGKITYGVNSVAVAGGGAVALTDLVTAATKIIVAGDFTDAAAAGSVFLSNSATCATSAFAGVLNAGKTSAEITVGTTAGGLSAAQDYALCYTIYASSNAASVQVPAQSSITAALDLTATATSSAADVGAAKVGEILRDGTELTAPFGSVNVNHTTRLVLTSSHSAPAVVQVTPILSSGSTCTAPAVALTAGQLTIPANSLLHIAVKDICTATTDGKLGLKLTIAAPKSKIEGVMQQYRNADASTGNITADHSAYPLARPAQ